MASVQPKEQLTLDGAQEQGFLSFYRGLPEKPSTTVIIFDRGDYYTVHGEDALLASRELFRTNSVVKLLGSGTNKVESVVLSRLNFESFVRDLLLVKQYRVEVYKQKNNKNDWQVEYKASPGNLTEFEDVLFGEHNELTVSVGVAAIKLATVATQRVVGVGYADTSGRLLRVSEFNDGESFSNLEALLIQLGPKECLLPSGDLGTDGVKLKQVLKRSNILVTERKRNEFSNKDASQDLGRLVSVRGKNAIAVASRPEFDNENAIASLAAVIKYLELLSDESNFGQFTLSSYDLKQFVRLDSAALRALHVEPGSLGVEAASASLARNTTLLGLLDKCRTPQGHRLLAQWVRQPLVDLNRINERLDLVEAIVSSAELRHCLTEDHLKRIPDFYRITRKLSRKAATLQDLYRLYQCMNRLPLLCEALAKYEGDHTSTIAAVLINPIQDLLQDLSKLVEMVETTMDIKQAEQGDFLVKPDFDDTLSDILEQKTSIKDDIMNEQGTAARDLGLDDKTLKLESNAQLGYFFRVTLKDEKVLRNNNKFKILDTNKSGVRFRSKSLQKLNEEYLVLIEEYKQQQKSIVDEIVNIACGFVEVIQNLGTALATLDCITALASSAVSAPIPYVRPVLHTSGTGDTKLTKCRHPCLELQDDISFISNDCNFDSENGKFHIITGPNMGGKSTYLRSVGAAVLMAHVGSFVACEEAEISIVDSILARVGAGDCQLKGVSTFMAEMLETATILHSATSRSLIIIDELGRGTSTYDGFGLAWAISEHIAKEINAFCLFATHFHELTALEELKSVKNYHVTATTANKTLTLLYQVKSGPCDLSFGIHVAELAHFPASVIEFAKRKAEQLEDVSRDPEDDDEESVKKRKLEKQAGEKIIEKCLNSAAGLDIGSLSNDELKAEVDKLRSGVLSSNNAYVISLLNRES